MASELWQRLREARKFANRTQLEMSKVAGVTRSAYAFWETPDPQSRTKPNVEQAVALCALTGVPVEWLLDDSAEVSDIYRDGGAAARVRARRQAELEGQPVVPQRNAQRFWAAVEFHVLAAEPSREGAFNRTVRAGAIELRADYLHAGRVAYVLGQATKEAVITAMGQALVAARAARQRDPEIFLVAYGAQEVPQDVAESAAKYLKTRVLHSEDPVEVARALLNT